ncbi:MAG: hypothetical protein H7X80_02345, partial [bacterium]|nr:hypothetical protein [Candidatus Kapabacteria bacterium]
FNSNFTDFQIIQTLRYPSPIVYMSPNGTNNAMVLISAGAPGGKPGVHTLSLNPIQPLRERTIDAKDMTSSIGRSPEFAGITLDNYLYVATSDMIFRVDVTALARAPERWLQGSFSSIAVDIWSGLLYAYDPVTTSVKRVAQTTDGNGEDLDPIAVPAAINAIEFVNSARVH